MLLPLVLAVLVPPGGAVGVGQPGAAGGRDGAPAVTAASAPVAVATLDRRLQDPQITESSGLARSTRDRSILWTHDDSGDTNRVFAVDAAGATQAVVTLGGARARDWEDIATGPGHTLWVGDIGDNSVRRTSVQIYRFVEPTDVRSTTVRATSYELVYPDGPHNAETLMVQPISGRVYVITKSRRGAAIYVAPRTLQPDSRNLLRKGRPAPAGITAGAFTPTSSSFTLRTHDRSLTYAGFPATPVAQRLPDMAQGESLEYDAAGTHLYVGSEGASSPVYRTTLPSVSSAPPPNQSVSLDWSPTRPAEPTGGVVRPESYGATGDGVTDDSVALQRALDVAASSNRKVELAANRTYLSNRRLALPSKTYLYGAGPTSVLRYTWSRYSDTHPAPFLINKNQSDGNTDIVLYKFAVRGPWSGLPAGPKSIQPAPLVPAIRFRGVRRFVIARLDVGYAAGISMLNQDSSNGLISRNHVHHSGRDGINTGTGFHVLVRDNLIENVGDDGIAMLSKLSTGVFSREVAATGNTINNWASNINGLTIGRGIALIGVHDTVVARNTVNRSHSNGIGLTPSHTPNGSQVWRNTNVTIVDNVVADAGQNYPGSDPRIPEPGHHGIALKRSDGVLVSGNVVTNPYDQKIFTFECGCTVR